MKHFNLSFLFLMLSYCLVAQSPATTAGGYFYATGTNYSLANMTGAAEVIGPEMEFVSTVTFELGFNFYFAGSNYSRFSVSSSGTMGLGTTPVSPIYYEPRNSILAPYYVFPMFSPWSDELTTAGNGGVSYKIFTVNNLKKLVVEWRLKAMSDEDESTDYNKTFQVWLWEGSNKIQYVYGNSSIRDENSFIGLAKSNPDYKLVNSSTHTIGMNSNSAWPGAGRSYIFSPVEIVEGPLPINLEAGGSTVNANCSGAANGSVTLGSISGGDGNYTITWSGPNGYIALGSTINNLGAGIYNFTITDGSNAAPLTGTRTITEPAMLNATISSLQACAGSNNGNITVSDPVGGSGNYEFSINNQGWQSSLVFNALPAGLYTLQMRDATNNSCVKDLGNQTVTEIVLDATLSSTATCAGTSNGSISISNATGGSSNYEYRLNNGNWQTATVFSGLSAGMYSVQMRDIAFDCIKNLTEQTINEFSLSASATATAACAGTSNGSISISDATGGSGNYEYRLNNGNWQTATVFSGLTAGMYSVQMRDIVFNDCIKNLTEQTINEYSIDGSLTSTAACAGTNNGSISISNAMGGSGNYEYSVNNGNWQTASLFSGLTAGIYSVQMRDIVFNDCIKNLGNQSVNEYSLNATLSSSAATGGMSNGSISISNANGGSGNYEYRLNNGNWQTATLFSGLIAGTYSVHMRDIAFTPCIKDLGTETISEYSLNAIVSSAPACTGTNNGSISISNASGGSGNYEYRINNGNWQSTPLFSGLSAGTYSVQMRDIAFTSYIKNLANQTVTAYSLHASAAATAACTGTSNGSISISNAGGGSGNYQYRLNNGNWQTGTLFSGLGAGTYSVQIREAAFIACITVLGNKTITEYSLNASVSSTATCTGTSNGTISISNASGGSGNYAYQLNNGNWQTTGIFTGLTNGTYAVKMRDANNTGCIKALGNITIAQAVAPAVSIAVNAPAFCNAITLTANAANAANYTWSNGATGMSTSLNNNHADGQYTVSVTNTNGCVGTASFMYSKQNYLSNYTVMGIKTVTFGENNTVNGSVGLILPGQTTSIKKNSVINGFVKSPVINLQQPVTITKGTINGIAFTEFPTLYFNTAFTAGLPNLTIPDDYNGPAINQNVNNLTIGKRARVTLNGHVFGKIIIKEAADVSFTAADISINDLEAENGRTVNGAIDYLSINFNANTIIRVKNTIKLGDRNKVNGFGSTFHMADLNLDDEKISIKGKNTIFNANTYMLMGILSITGSTATERCIMNGTFIAGEVLSDKYVTWSSVECAEMPSSFRGIEPQPEAAIPASEIITMVQDALDKINKTATKVEQTPVMPVQTAAIEKPNTGNEGIAVYPSPTTGNFKVQLNTSDSRATISIVNQLGLEISREHFTNFAKGKSVTFDISKYTAGIYYIKVITATGVYTKQLIKTN